MTMVRRPGFTLLAALLAFLAILGVFALSGWHSAMVDDADPVHAVSIGHVDPAPDKADPDGPVHLVAHATAQFLSIGMAARPSAFPTRGERVWVPLVPSFRDGSDAAGILRPPQG